MIKRIFNIYVHPTFSTSCNLAVYVYTLPFPALVAWLSWPVARCFVSYTAGLRAGTAGSFLLAGSASVEAGHPTLLSKTTQILIIIFHKIFDFFFHSNFNFFSH